MIQAGRVGYLLHTLILILVATSVSPLGEGVYRSNATGMRLEYLGSVQSEVQPSEDYPYLLRISRLHAADTDLIRYEQILEHVDGLQSRTIIDMRDDRRVREREYTGDGFEERFFSAQGMLERVEIHDEAGLREEHSYRYEAARLVEVRRQMRDDSESHIERFRYRPDGRIRSITRRYDSGAERWSEYLFRGDILIEEWHSDGREDLFVRFDSDGRLIRADADVDGDPVESERLVWARAPGQDAAHVETRTQVDHQRGRVVTTTYDPSGRVLNEKIEEDGVLIRERFLVYEADRLQTEEILRPGGPSERVQFSYDERGELEYSERSRDGVLLSRREYSGNGLVTETRFVGGEPVLRIEFEDEVRVRELILEDGEVIRERVF